LGLNVRRGKEEERESPFLGLEEEDQKIDEKRWKERSEEGEEGGWG
jgi:hypothetical protein